MCEKPILYLECFSGISGDMTVGALLDLGVDPDKLRQALDSLHVEGYSLHIGRTSKNGIDACDFDVILEQDAHDHAHTHDHDEHGHEHHHEHEHEHHHEHEHEHHHEHEHTHHSHVHRGIREIFDIIDQSGISAHSKQLARQMFQVVAEAESKAHGIPVEEVHFHEVGAIDSIVDIVAVAVCLDELGIEQAVVSPLYDGSGHIHCQHGIIPVPVPAVVNIASAHGLTLHLTDNMGEMVTPTGAAIAAVVGNRASLPQRYTIQKIGLGAGKRDYPRANLLRAMLIQPEEGEQEGLWKLEANMDDCTGEALGFAMEQLLEAGARDVWYTPIYMKKNRPGVLLSVLCDGRDIPQMEQLIFRHTTTIGIRRYQVERTVLPRRIMQVQGDFGTAQVKVCGEGETARYAPEYDSVREICRTTGRGFDQVMEQVRACAREQDS